MRELKFRGKSSIPGRWVIGDSIKHTDNATRDDIAEITYIGSKVPNARKVGAMKWVPVDPSTIGQYTGLKDRKGKEIYEGDIVLLGENCKIPYVVEWQDETAMFIISTRGFVICGCATICDSNDFRQVEAFGGCRIIGNIHDNPELMKGEWYDNRHI